MTSEVDGGIAKTTLLFQNEFDLNIEQQKAYKS